jgi:O-antigen biosynthesis protein
VNVGLARALAEGRDALLINADVEFTWPGWLEALQARTDTQDRPAAVVGGLLLFPSGLIQHAGVYFSLLGRGFDHRFRYAPATLPEAHVPSRCPVTGALQLIRHECLEAVGLYDEAFRLGFEDVDFCLRVFASGRESIYEPAAMATHHESLFRGTPTRRISRWQQESLELLRRKHMHTDFSPWVPPVL